jgi:toxin ParE1/3/4
MNRVLYTLKARRDIDDIAEYIAVDNLDAAIHFCVAVEDALDKLVQLPGMGRLREFDNPALVAVRSWPIKGFANYLVFYRPLENGIEVLRIIHGSRDIEAIFMDS